MVLYRKDVIMSIPRHLVTTAIILWLMLLAIILIIMFNSYVFHNVVVNREISPTEFALYIFALIAVVWVPVGVRWILVKRFRVDDRYLTIPVIIALLTIVNLIAATRWRLRLVEFLGENMSTIVILATATAVVLIPLSVIVYRRRYKSAEDYIKDAIKS